MTEKEFGMVFGTVMKREATKRGISMPTLAKLAGASKSAIYYFLSGFNRPTGYLFINIVTALGMSLDDFVKEIREEIKKL